ncbi:MAG TPA: integrin alpha, partial [Candidatus Dormibacteraeota bacterium]|nr:integrin alpha [Candidatus Dormibacteraeota bacterium]
MNLRTGFGRDVPQRRGPISKGAVVAVALAALAGCSGSASARTLVTLVGATPGDTFGGAVAAAGDLNGDGFADLIVGAYQCDAGGLDAGRAYVYYGG